MMQYYVSLNISMNINYKNNNMIIGALIGMVLGYILCRSAWGKDGYTSDYINSTLLVGFIGFFVGMGIQFWVC